MGNTHTGRNTTLHTPSSATVLECDGLRASRQVLALAMASHPRCGARSLLVVHNDRATGSTWSWSSSQWLSFLRVLWEDFVVGAAVHFVVGMWVGSDRDPRGVAGSLSVRLGVSPLVMGVVGSVRPSREHSDCCTWLDYAHSFGSRICPSGTGIELTIVRHEALLAAPRGRGCGRANPDSDSDPVCVLLRVPVRCRYRANHKWLVVCRQKNGDQHTPDGANCEVSITVVRIPKLNSLDFGADGNNKSGGVAPYSFNHVPEDPHFDSVELVRLGCAATDEAVVVLRGEWVTDCCSLLLIVANLPDSVATGNLAVVSSVKCHIRSECPEVICVADVFVLVMTSGIPCFLVKISTDLRHDSAYFVSEAAMEQVMTKVDNQLQVSQLTKSLVCISSTSPSDSAEIWDCSNATTPLSVITLNSCVESTLRQSGGTFVAHSGFLFQSHNEKLCVVDALSGLCCLCVPIPHLCSLFAVSTFFQS